MAQTNKPPENPARFREMVPVSASEDLPGRASRLKAAGRLEEALALNLQALAANPRSAVAEHNLAATLGDLDRHAEAAEAAMRAFAKGGTAPETWLVRARALQGAGAHEAAERAYEEAIARRPDYLDAHRDLAQLRWMRTADPKAALQSLDTLPLHIRNAPAMLLARGRILGGIGAAADALAALLAAVAQAPREPVLRIAAARAAGQAGDPEQQLTQARAAAALAPSASETLRSLAEALFNRGEPAEGLAIAERLAAAYPADQGLAALRETGWRLTGDPRHAECEAPELISSSLLPVPPGWPDLPVFLADLAAALDGLHVWRTHPLEQSVRHGSQSSINLVRSELPVIRALFAALATPIDSHIARIGGAGGWRIATAWSVRLLPGGFHSDHVHPEGWLSSAFHVSVPEATERGHEGWLAFGRPGIPTRPPLTPFRHVRPEAGRLVLFPSWLWHGTEPFGGDAPRLTVAFDIVAA